MDKNNKKGRKIMNLKNTKIIIMTKSKTAMTITIILMLSVTILLASLPIAIAQEPMKMKTYAYIGATPNPVSVNRETLFHVGVAHAQLRVDKGWEGLTVTVTKPDGTSETLGPYRTDSTGGKGVIYVPTMVGLYYVQTHFPEQQIVDGDTRAGAGVYPPTPNGTILLADDSDILELTVTEEQQTYWPDVPLPTEYWSRPIDGQLRGWNMIAGNVLAIGRGTDGPQFAPYNDSPETAHILWANPLQLGGLAGGMEVGPQAYDDGSAYEGLFLNSVIINGILYYNQFKAQGDTRVEQNVVAMDIRTGEELWTKPLIDPEGVSRRLAFGQVFYWDSYNMHAVFAYLWTTSGSTWNAHDPFTGRWVYSMENVPSGTNMYGAKGEIYRYRTDLEKGWMILWNSSRVVSDAGSWLSGDVGRIFDATEGIEWNITIPKELPGSVAAVVLGDRVIGTRVGPLSRRIPYSEIPMEINSWAFSLKPGQEGQLLFNNAWSAPDAWSPENGVRVTPGIVSVEDDVFTIWIPELRQHWGFSIKTGQPIWGPTEPQFYLDYWNSDIYAYEGKLFASWMSGTLYCYDIKTGERLWTYDANDQFSEILWSGNWPIRPSIYSDGKVYIGHCEHSVVDPKSRGAPFICLNATTGEEIFRVNGVYWGSHHGGAPIIADSSMIICDGYDQRIYAVGRGPSATTVEAPMTGIAVGDSLVLRGTVTDISPGTKEYALAARFPNGVPAVADEVMSEWMLYVYKQFARPAIATGVEVILNVIDANGNFREIGKTTSDLEGFFSYVWTPDIPGKYTVIATFDGSESYWPSDARTAFVADPAPQPTPDPTSTPGSMTDTYLTGSTVAILAGLGIAVFLLLRKK